MKPYKLNNGPATRVGAWTAEMTSSWVGSTVKARAACGPACESSSARDACDRFLKCVVSARSSVKLDVLLSKGNEKRWGDVGDEIFVKDAKKASELLIQIALQHHKHVILLRPCHFSDCKNHTDRLPSAGFSVDS